MPMFASQLTPLPSPLRRTEGDGMIEQEKDGGMEKGMWRFAKSPNMEKKYCGVQGAFCAAKGIALRSLEWVRLLLSSFSS